MVLIVYVPEADTLVKDTPVQFTKFLLNTDANFPSWNAAGITAGLTVLILAKVTPLEVPKESWVNITADAEVEVVALEPVLEKVQLCDPLTLKSVAPPLVKLPKPNS